MLMLPNIIYAYFAWHVQFYIAPDFHIWLWEWGLPHDGRRIVDLHPLYQLKCFILVNWSIATGMQLTPFLSHAVWWHLNDFTRNFHTYDLLCSPYGLGIICVMNSPIYKIQGSSTSLQLSSHVFFFLQFIIIKINIFISHYLVSFSFFIHNFLYFICWMAELACPGWLTGWVGLFVDDDWDYLPFNNKLCLMALMCITYFFLFFLFYNAHY